MRLIRVIGIIALFLVVSACATAPTSSQLASADYGSYPDNYQEIVKAYYSQRLFDPYSAHYRWIKEPYPGCFMFFGKFDFGYIVLVGINAKNRMGGYVGEKQEALLIKNGVVVDMRPASMLRN